MPSMKPRIQSWVAHPYFPILVLLLVNLVLGALITTDYGESWDEDRRIRYANKSLAAYQGVERNLQDEKGAFYVMLARLGAGALDRLIAGWNFIHAWHFFSFLSFLIALFSLYVLCLRLTSPPAALGATLLFNTQPLLWGHAFINPKDIPFMAFFLASVAAGLSMVDHYRAPARTSSSQAGIPEPPPVRYRALLAADWRAGSSRHRNLLAILAACAVGLLSLTWLAWLARASWIPAGVRWIYAAAPGSWVGRLFDQFAANARALPVENYINKAQVILASLLPIAGIALLVVSLYLLKRLFPCAAARLVNERLRPALRQAGAVLTDRRLLLAAILLGFASAIRTLGPFSGALVGGYLLWKARRNAILPLIVYFVLGALVTVACWPYLWQAPIANYLRSFATASEYPFESIVLFTGREYDQSPAGYFPVLLTIQLSGTALIAIIFGMGATIDRWVRRAIDRPAVVLLATWLILPPGVAILTGAVMYDNFRQFLFVLPPLFVYAAIGFEWIMAWLRRWSLRANFAKQSPAWERRWSLRANFAKQSPAWLQKWSLRANFAKQSPAWLYGLLLFILLLPNLLAMIQLHPYEYVYYNRLAGGVEGAFRRYETDYWATSYQEAIEYLNRSAPPGANLVVWGPAHIVRKYIRPDIEVDTYFTGQPQAEIRSDYLLVSTRENADLKLFPEQPALFSVGRAGAIFSLVRRLPPDNRINP